MTIYKNSFMSLIVLGFLSLSLTVQAQSSRLTKCRLVKHFQQQINEDRESLAMLERLQSEKMQAREIMTQVDDYDDVHEIRLLAEALEEEAGILQEDQSLNVTGAVGTSIGSVMLAAYIVKSVNADTRGLSLRQRIYQGAVMPQRGQRLRKYGFNSALIFGVASTFWLAREIRANQNERNFLYEIIERLNRLRDVSEEIVMLRSQIEDKELILSERIMELEDEGLAKVVGPEPEIECL